VIRLRRTVAKTIRFSGLGLHSGTPVEMVVHPSSDGIAFRIGSERVTASPENVTDTTRCTRLGSISTIEHLMSAFAGLEITDAEVELTAPEIPGMDGSSKLFVEAILASGFQDGAEESIPGLYRRIFLQDDKFEIAVAKGNGHWRYVFETGKRWPGTQVFESASVTQSYVEQIAPARTFAFSEELPMIMKMGLGQGLDERSALILGPATYENQARFVDEPARHKLLDLIGDLYLTGIPIKMLNVVAEKSGHTGNVQAAALLQQAVQITG